MQKNDIDFIVAQLLRCGESDNIKIEKIWRQKRQQQGFAYRLQPSQL